MFAGKAGAYTSEATLGQVPGLTTYIRLGWNILTRTNILPYYEKSKLTTVKSFITLATDLKIGSIRREVS
jgi:hypothetical protein